MGSTLVTLASVPLGAFVSISLLTNNSLSSKYNHSIITLFHQNYTKVTKVTQHKVTDGWDNIFDLLFCH